MYAKHPVFAAFAEIGRGTFLLRFIGPDSGEPAIFLPATIILNHIDEVDWPANIEVGTGALGVRRSSFRFGQGLFAAVAPDFRGLSSCLEGYLIACSEPLSADSAEGRAHRG